MDPKGEAFAIPFLIPSLVGTIEVLVNVGGGIALFALFQSDQNSNSDADSSDDSLSEDDTDCDNKSNPKQDKKLTKGEINKLKKNGIDPEKLKGGKNTGKIDLFKDKHGNIKVKPKSGAGEGDPTFVNINDLFIN